MRDKISSRISRSAFWSKLSLSSPSCFFHLCYRAAFGQTRILDWLRLLYLSTTWLLRKSTGSDLSFFQKKTPYSLLPVWIAFSKWFCYHWCWGRTISCPWRSQHHDKSDLTFSFWLLFPVTSLAFSKNFRWDFLFWREAFACYLYYSVSFIAWWLALVTFCFRIDWHHHIKNRRRWPLSQPGIFSSSFRYVGWLYWRSWGWGWMLSCWMIYFPRRLWKWQL